MKVVIVEDEPTAARRLRRLLTAADSTLEILASLDSVDQAARWFTTNPPPDVIFMDIELVDGTAFEIFERAEINTPVIFCTAYDRYAVRAFKVNSIDYLLKPVETPDLLASLQKLRRLHPATPAPPIPWAELERLIRGANDRLKTRFLVGSARELRPVPVEDIALFFTREKIVRLLTFEGQAFLLDQSLDELEGLVSPVDFFRVNRQTLLALKAIDSVRTDLGRLYARLRLSKPREILVSRERSKAFRAWLDH